MAVSVHVGPQHPGEETPFSHSALSTQHPCLVLKIALIARFHCHVVPGSLVRDASLRGMKVCTSVRAQTFEASRKAMESRDVHGRFEDLESLGCLVI